MLIEAEKLKEFLRKITVNNKIPTLHLNFKEEGVESKLVSVDVMFVTAQLNKTAFKEYEAIGEVGINDSRKLLGIVERYKGKVIKLTKEENDLKIVSETGSANIRLCEAEYVDNKAKQEFPLDKFDEGFFVDAAKFESIKQAGEILKTESMKLIIKDKKLTLTVNNDTGDKIVESVEVGYNDCSSQYGKFLGDVIAVIQGSVNVAFADKFPIRVTEMTNDYTINYIVAPFIENEE